MHCDTRMQIMKRINEAPETLVNISGSVVVEVYVNTPNYPRLTGFPPIGFSVECWQTCVYLV